MRHSDRRGPRRIPRHAWRGPILNGVLTNPNESVIMRFLSPQEAVAIEDQHNPCTVTKSETVWNGRIVDMIKDHVIVVEGQDPVVREYTRHPGAVAVVVLRGESGGRGDPPGASVPSPCEGLAMGNSRWSARYSR